MWSPDLPAVTTRVDFSPPASRGSKHARKWSGRSLRRRGRTLQEIRAPWLGWPDNRHSTLLGHGIQRDRRQNRGFGRRDDNSSMGVCWPVSGSTCAPGVVDVAIIPPDKSAGTNTSGTATPATCWCTGSRSTTCRHGFSCAIPSQGLEDPPQVRSGCSAGWTAAVDQRPSVGYDRHDCRIAEDIGRVIAMPHRFQLRRTTEQE